MVATPSWAVPSHSGMVNQRPGEAEITAFAARAFALGNIVCRLLLEKKNAALAGELDFYNHYCQENCPQPNRSTSARRRLPCADVNGCDTPPWAPVRWA